MIGKYDEDGPVFTIDSLKTYTANRRHARRTRPAFDESANMRKAKDGKPMMGKKPKKRRKK